MLFLSENGPFTPRLFYEEDGRCLLKITYFTELICVFYFKISPSHPTHCRFGTDRTSIGDTHTSHKRAPVAEPNIDFELDIKLDVDCGKCALHPKDTETEVKR